MKTVSELFSCWDTVPQMACDVGVPEARAKKWLQRKRIPHTAWPALMAALKRKGEDVSADDLLAMHSPKPPRRSSERARA
jgi:hypothetical protein